MKKRLLVVGCMLLLSQSIGCTLFQTTCKESGCDETDIYKDGYCKYHYYINEGEDIIKEFVN